MESVEDDSNGGIDRELVEGCKAWWTWRKGGVVALKGRVFCQADISITGNSSTTTSTIPTVPVMHQLGGYDRCKSPII